MEPFMSFVNNFVIKKATIVIFEIFFRLVRAK